MTFAISAKRNGNWLNSGWLVSRVNRSCKKSVAVDQFDRASTAQLVLHTYIEPIGRHNVAFLLELQVYGHPKRDATLGGWA